MSCVIGSIEKWSVGVVVDDITVTNNGSEPVNNWLVEVVFEQPISLVSAWSADASVSGSTVTATGTSYNQYLAPGASTSFGINASHNAGSNLSDPVCMVPNGN